VRFNPAAEACVDSPIGAAFSLLAERARHVPDAHARPVLDLSQAAPPWPPAPEVVAHVAATAGEPDGGTYTEVPGIPKLREAVATEIGHDYDGVITPADVAVTAGCNQAFSLVASTLAAPGDEIVVPLPAYFNHEMWLRLAGVRPVLLEPGPDLVPRAADAEALVTQRTRAIVLVTPNNPTGVTLEPSVIAEFAQVARRHDIALIVDET
jgi:aspartate/methionine/tyrosine aminotransferase